MITREILLQMEEEGKVSVEFFQLFPKTDLIPSMPMGWIFYEDGREYYCTPNFNHGTAICEWWRFKNQAAINEFLDRKDWR